MPNYVKNRIAMNGIDNLPLFKDEDGKTQFDFNKLIPMPKSLEITAGSQTEQSIMYYLTERGTKSIFELSKESFDIMKACVKNESAGDKWVFDVLEDAIHMVDAQWKTADEMYKLGEQYVENYKKYGATTWYDWRIANWGTKWNACETKITNDMIEFETAWDNPAPIVMKLAEMYPNTVIEHWWADEDKGANTGYRKIKNRMILTERFYQTDSEEAYATYNALW